MPEVCGYQLKWTKCLQTVYNCRHFRLPTSRALRRAQRAPETCLRLVSSSTWTAQAVVGGPGHPPAAKVSCRHAQERGRRKEGQPFFSKNGCSERVPREVRAARVPFSDWVVSRSHRFRFEAPDPGFTRRGSAPCSESRWRREAPYLYLRYGPPARTFAIPYLRYGPEARTFTLPELRWRPCGRAEVGEGFGALRTPSTRKCTRLRIGCFATMTTRAAVRVAVRAAVRAAEVSRWRVPTCASAPIAGMSRA